MDEYILDTSDRISPLPDFIVHHILSFLDSYTDLLKISVLSKRWFTLWATFPILDFDISKMLKALQEIKCKNAMIPTRALPLDLDVGNSVRETLIRYASYTLSRFSEHNVVAHKFTLIMGIQEATDATYFDKWISLAIKHDVRVLDICVWSPPENKYCLPKTLLSTRSLTSLKLFACKLPSSLLVDRVKFKSLKSLCLRSVHIKERLIKRLTIMCPLIEKFKILNCYGFKVFCVSGHKNLRRIKAIIYDEVETIDIKAPNLTYLSISNPFGKTTPLINLFSCKNLKNLYLGTLKFGTTGFCELIPNFPVLESLHLDDCDLEKNLKISSLSLRKFELGYCNEMEEIRIDAPNLILFRYVGDAEQPIISLTSDFVKWEACIYFVLQDEQDIRWFHDLRQFLGMENKFKVLELCFDIHTEFMNVDEPIGTPPYELEHLKLTIEPLPSLVDALFWCCRPQSLSFVVNRGLLFFEERNDFFKHVYKKLLHQYGECQKEIEIRIVGGSKTEKGFISLDSLLDALPRLEVGQEIIFRTKR